MRAVSRSASVVLCLAATLPRGARAQDLGGESAPAPDLAESEAIERAWRDREGARLLALRHRARWYVEAGGAVLLYSEHVTDAVTLRREPSLGASLAVGLRYGINAYFEVQGSVEVIGPLALGAIDNGAFARVATAPCDGSRRFDLAPGTAALVSLAVGFRVRVFRALSPFYVGGGLRLTGQVSGGGGAYAVRCVDDGGRETSRLSGNAAAEAVTPDVGAYLETGYRVGERETWDVGIRMLTTVLSTPAPGGAQFFVGWSFR